ncbi:MAG: coproporphyrinogen dehydrogenase HemZ [Defluviitaleaceae bacterium]|nr:coproporphyrinogen dehydrogenase HemZ [Defluviitaleaceae bacterium]
MKFELRGLDGRFTNELQTIAQIFYPNESFESFGQNIRGEVAPDEVNISCVREGDMLRLCVRQGADIRAEALCEAAKMPLKLALYGALKAFTGRKPAWGSLTGIRPGKLALDSLRRGLTQPEVLRLLTETYDADEAKARLALAVALAEAPFVAADDPGYSLYVGIPFCPSKCLYCSFTSYPVGKHSGLTGTYLDCLEKELEFLARHTHAKAAPASVYIGGGTPSALSAGEIDRLLGMIAARFDTAGAAEYSFEAGRADTITRDKLDVLREYGVTRVCVNPQSLHDTTLAHIGRCHTAADFARAFGMVRAAGFRTINSDIILGLGSETARDVAATLDYLAELAPENITIHTLALKRGSRLAEGGFCPADAAQARNIEEMLELSASRMERARLAPYYMYRQKNSPGSFENVGYSQPGHESIYNIQIMAEKQTILAAGAGAVTKLYNPGTNELRRVFNVKSLDDYMSRIDEMIGRKAELVYD